MTRQRLSPQRPGLSLLLLLLPLTAQARSETCSLDQSQPNGGCGQEVDHFSYRYQEFVVQRPTICELGFYLHKEGSPGGLRVSVHAKNNQLALFSEVLDEQSVQDGLNLVQPGAGLEVVTGEVYELRLQATTFGAQGCYVWDSTPYESYLPGSSDVPGQDYRFRICSRGLTWTSGPPLPEPRIDTAAAIVDKRIVITGGAASDQGGAESVLCWILPLEAFDEPWSWTATGSLNEPRRYHSLTRYGDRLFAVDGFAGYESLGTVEARLPAGQWMPLSVQLPPDFLHTTWIHEERLYVAGRDDADGSSVRSFPLTGGTPGDERLELPPPVARRGAEAAVLGNQVFLLGGRVAPYYQSFTQEILRSEILPDGSLAGWVSAGSLPPGVEITEAPLVIGSRVVLLGNYEVWLGQVVEGASGLELGSWTDLGVLPGGVRDRMSAVVDGRRLWVLGGQDGNGAARGETWFADLDEFLEEGVAFGYGPLSANSQGEGARLACSGTLSFSEQANAGGGFRLEAEGCPPDQIGLFLCGTEPTLFESTGSDGYRCVGGHVVRLKAVPTGPNGRPTLLLDLSSDLAELGPIEPFTTLYFQLWYRDPGQGSNSNLSTAISVTLGS